MKKTPGSIFARRKRHHGKINANIFLETFKMINIFLAFRLGAASGELSFICLKMIITRLRSHLSDCSVAQLMRISNVGTEIDAVKFEEIMEICKEHNHRILL